MIFSTNKKKSAAQESEPANSLLRVLQLFLEGCALHAVEFDSEEHTAFRIAIRGIADRFDLVQDPRDFLVLAGETNKTVQGYQQMVEKFIRDLSTEKHLAVELLSRSLLRVCHASVKSAQSLREIEKELARASQLQDMREVRAKLAECVGVLCLEAEVQEVQSRELKDQVSESSDLLELRDPITGLGMLKSAESRIRKIGAVGAHGYVVAFFLKNVDIVNRRFGFAAGDDVLKRFAAYLAKNLQESDQLFRWRGPCFVVIADRFTSIDAAQSAAYQVGVRGPEVQVENGGNSMLIRLSAATGVFPIPVGQGVAGISAKIDQFGAEQFKISPLSR